MVLGNWGGYMESRGGATLRSRYRLAGGRLYQLQDTAFVVLLLDSSRFFPRTGRLPAGIAVRALRGDTLVLSGTGSDASLHTFVRPTRAR